LVDTGADVVMQQYLIVFVSLFSHYGSTYLAETCAMSPSGSGEDETPGDAGLRHFCAVYDKGGAVKV